MPPHSRQMSAQQACELCRILASLNYDGQQTLVTPESFVKPNFELVSDILIWVARILVEDQEEVNLISKELEVARHSETYQVAFLLSISKLLYSKLQLQLDLVPLYKADSECCPELLKIAEPIYRATHMVVNKKFNNECLPNSCRPEPNFTTLKQISSLLEKDGNISELALSIKPVSEDLDSLLNNEIKFNEERTTVIDRRLEIVDIGTVLRSAHSGIVEKTKKLAQANEEFESDLVRLDERLAQKETEVQGAKDRLNDLLVQSPAYVDSYQKLLTNYHKAYETYVSKYRNLCYLKSCVYPSDSNSNDVTPSPGTHSTHTYPSNKQGLDDMKLRSRTGSPEQPKENAGNVKRLTAQTTQKDIAATRDELATISDDTSLELEGLLNEFVADSELNYESGGEKSEVSEKEDLLSDDSTTSDTY